MTTKNEPGAVNYLGMSDAERVSYLRAEIYRLNDAILELYPVEAHNLLGENIIDEAIRLQGDVRTFRDVLKQCRRALDANKAQIMFPDPLSWAEWERAEAMLDGILGTEEPQP